MGAAPVVRCGSGSSAGSVASPEAPVLAALGDTILKKTGRRIPGVKVCYGLRFVQVSALVSPRETAGPARALPVGFDFAPPANKPKKNAPPEAWHKYKQERKKRTLSMAGVEAIASLDRPDTR